MSSAPNRGQIAGRVRRAALISFYLFSLGISQPGDLDAIGNTFTAAVGVLILLMPLVVLWIVKGSKPRSTPLADSGVLRRLTAWMPSEDAVGDTLAEGTAHERGPVQMPVATAQHAAGGRQSV